MLSPMPVQPGRANNNARGKAFYDAAYQKKGHHYRGPWTESPYREMWQAICRLIPKGSRVLEVGCGPGQLGAMICAYTEPSSYRGFDFSKVAIDLAKKNIEPYKCAEVHIGDCRSQTPFSIRPYDCLVCTEVLEHIEDDHGIFRKARADGQAHVIFSVPNTDSESHVRYFDASADVVGRYQEHFEALTVTSHRHPNKRLKHAWFVCSGKLRR